MPLLLVLLVSSLPAPAQDLPFVCGRVTGMETDLDPGFDYRDTAFLWFEPSGSSTRMELATLDAQDGLLVNPWDWGSVFDGDFGLADDLGMGYDPQAEGPLFIATLPAPAHDLLLSTDRGKVTVHLPDTSHLRLGATFLVADDGSTWWAEQDHDGVTVDDRLDWDDSLSEEHLARAAHEAAADAGEPPESSAWLEQQAGQAGSRAFTFDPDGEPVRLGYPDGSPVEPDDVPFALGEAFDVLDEGASVGTPYWRGPTGRATPLEARFQDLSDCSGWPDVEVLPGFLAVDPRYGRFAFSAGNPDQELALRSHFHQHWNSNGGFTVVGDRAWLSFGESDSSLAIVDISDPAAMELLGLSDEGWCYSSAEHGGWAYVSCRGYVAAVDVSDEANPLLASTLSLSYGTSTLWDRAGTLLGYNGEGITILDTTDPAKPSELSLIPLPIDDEISASGNESAWALSDSLLLAKVEGYDLLRLYDISNIESPDLLSTFLYSGKGVGVTPLIHPHQQVLYLGTGGDGLWVVDLSDTASPLAWQIYQALDVDPDDEPQQVDQCTGLGMVDGVLYESGSYGWADWGGSSPWDGHTLSYVRAWDITDPLEPELIQEWQDDSITGNVGSYVDVGDFAIVQVSGYGLRSVDLSAGDPFQWIGGYQAAGQTTDVELAGDMAYLSGYLGGGITAVDISDPDDPVERGYAHHGLDTYGLGVKYGADGTWVFTSGKSTVSFFDDSQWRYTDLTVWDFTEPGSAQVVGRAQGTCHLVVDAWDDLLQAGCNLWDISEPTAPVQLNESCIASGEAAALMGNLLVYGTGRSQLSGSLLDSGEDSYVLVDYDVAIPAAPVMLAMLEIPDSGGGMLSTNVVIRGEAAFFVNGVGVVQVDVSDPRNPFQVGSLLMDGYDPESLDVAGDFLYVQCQHDDLLVYDISGGLSSAVEAGHGYTYVSEITRLHGYQLLSATADGLYLTDVPRSADTPAGPVEVRWYQADQAPEDPSCDTGGTGHTGDTAQPLPHDSGAAGQQDSGKTDAGGCGCRQARPGGRSQAASFLSFLVLATCFQRRFKWS